MSPAVAQHPEAMLSERMRQRWRIFAVDDDLQTVLGRRVLVAGRDMRNIGLELKPISAGPLDLNDRQYDVLRAARSDVPPFVLQFTYPPDAWCFRLFPLREDALEVTDGHAGIVLNEREIEALTYTLVMGGSFPFTEVQTDTGMRFGRPGAANFYPGYCINCGAWIDAHRGRRLMNHTINKWAVIHRSCPVPSAVTAIEVTFAGGEPAIYLSGFDQTFVADDVWPEVTAPRSYTAPPLRDTYTTQARALLRTWGKFTDDTQVFRRPDLKVVTVSTSADELVARALSHAGRQPSDAGIESTVRALERHVATERILRTPWIDLAALRARERTAERLLRSGIPGPFVGSDRKWRPGVDSDEVVDYSGFDITGILEQQAAARRKRDASPRCSICGQPMMAGQSDHHVTCGATNRLRGLRADWTAEDWRGLARMARARQAAGVPLTEDDREALRRGGEAS